MIAAHGRVKKIALFAGCLLLPRVFADGDHAGRARVAKGAARRGAQVVAGTQERPAAPVRAGRPAPRAAPATPAAAVRPAVHGTPATPAAAADRRLHRQRRQLRQRRQTGGPPAPLVTPGAPATPAAADRRDGTGGRGGGTGGAGSTGTGGQAGKRGARRRQRRQAGGTAGQGGGGGAPAERPARAAPAGTVRPARSSRPPTRRRFSSARMCNAALSIVQCTHLVSASLVLRLPDVGQRHDRARQDPSAVGRGRMHAGHHLPGVLCINPGTKAACVPANSGDLCIRGTN